MPSWRCGQYGSVERGISRYSANWRWPVKSGSSTSTAARWAATSSRVQFFYPSFLALIYHIKGGPYSPNGRNEDRSQNVVDVNYQIMTLDKHSGQWSGFQEIHSMRYFFLPEIEKYLSDAGFSLKRACRWMSANPLSLEWYGLVVAEKGR